MQRPETGPHGDPFGPDGSGEWLPEPLAEEDAAQHAEMAEKVIRKLHSVSDLLVKYG